MPVSDHRSIRSREVDNPATDEWSAFGTQRTDGREAERKADERNSVSEGADDSAVSKELSPKSADSAVTGEQPECRHVPGWVSLWLRRSDQIFVGTLAIVLGTLIVCHWVRLSRWGLEPVEIERQQANVYQFRIDINRATWVEWTQLEGIGPILAQRIVDDRQQHGPYATIEELQRVKGIGPKTIERLRPWLEVSRE